MAEDSAGAKRSRQGRPPADGEPVKETDDEEAGQQLGPVEEQVDQDKWAQQAEDQPQPGGPPSE